MENFMEEYLSLFPIGRGAIQDNSARANFSLSLANSYEKSGIFSSIATVKPPIWQIKFADADRMQRCVVALQNVLYDLLEKIPTGA